MRVIKNNVNKSDFPKKIECENCGSELEIDESDVKIGYIGLYYVDCPVCNKQAYIYDLDGINVIKDNIKFPDHFYHFGDGGKRLDDVEIEEYIREGIEWHRKNPNQFVWDGGTGDSDIAIYNYPGDEMYRIVVAKGYYSCEIKYETEDYNVQDCDSWKNKGVRVKE